MKRLFTIALFVAMLCLVGTSRTSAQEELENYYYDNYFGCGLTIPGDWKAVDIETFRPTIIPTGISPESFEKYWYEEIRLVPGIRVCWVRRMAGNNYASMYLRFAPVYYMLESGQRLGMMGVGEVKEALDEWAGMEGASASAEQASLGGIQGWRYRVDGPGYGFAIDAKGLTPTSSLIYACSIYREGFEYLFMVCMSAPSECFEQLTADLDEAVAGLAFGEPEKVINLAKYDPNGTVRLPAGPPAQFNMTAPPASAFKQQKADAYLGSVLIIEWPDAKDLSFNDLQTRGQIIEILSRFIAEEESVSSVRVMLQYPSNELSAFLNEIFSGALGAEVVVQPMFQQGSIEFIGPASVSVCNEWLDSITLPLDFRVINVEVHVGEEWEIPESTGSVLLGEGATTDSTESLIADLFGGIILEITWQDKNELSFNISDQEQFESTIKKMLREDETISDLTTWFQFEIDENIVEPYYLWSSYLAEEIMIKPIYMIGYLDHDVPISVDDLLDWLHRVEMPPGLEVLSFLVGVTEGEQWDSPTTSAEVEEGLTSEKGDEESQSGKTIF